MTAAPEAVEFFGSAEAAERWGDVLSALHAFGRVDGAPLGESVTDWFVRRTRDYHAHFAAAKRAQLRNPLGDFERERIAVGGPSAVNFVENLLRALERPQPAPGGWRMRLDCVIAPALFEDEAALGAFLAGLAKRRFDDGRS